MINTAFMSNLAVAGGTPKAEGCEGVNDCYYQIGEDNFTADLQAVLTEIAGQIASCTFALPLDSDDVDPNLVNVSYKVGDGEEEELYRAPSREDGWDYTDDSQTHIELFGPACDAIKENTNSTVKALYKRLIKPNLALTSTQGNTCRSFGESYTQRS